MRAFLILGAAFVALGACAGQSMIGSHVGAVDFASNANVRIICTTCPATTDYQAERTNIRFNEKTGIIEKVDCG
ncbi:Peptidase inhibitor I78 family protein [compost metagenome]